MPIKYNLKDLRDKYKDFERDEDYKKLLQNSYEWRKAIFKKADALDYTIVLSCIESFKKGKKVAQKKDDLLRYGFSMALMRVGMECQSSKKDVILY